MKTIAEFKTTCPQQSTEPFHFQNLIDTIVRTQFSTATMVTLDKDEEMNLQQFVDLYNEKYGDLKREVHRMRMHFDTSTMDVTRRISDWEKKKQQDLQAFQGKLKRLKMEVMEPTYTRLGAEVVEASQSARDLVNLMYRKRVTSDECHRIISGLVRWHVLDEVQAELQRQMQPLRFKACFEGFAEDRVHPGHPTDNLYELADKEHLRTTLEALHRERHGTTVHQGWAESQSRTNQFLMAFMLSLYRRPLQSLYGKMAAFHRFFRDVCGYGFVKTARTLQHWFGAYQDFVNECRRREGCVPKADARWESKVRKYDAMDALVEWMQGCFPQYGVKVV